MKVFQVENPHPFQCLFSSGKIYVNFGSVYALNSRGDYELVIPKIRSGELSRDFETSPSYIDIEESQMGAVCLNINCYVGYDGETVLSSDNETLKLWSSIFDTVFYKQPSEYRDYTENYITKQESGYFVKDVEIYEVDAPWSKIGETREALYAKVLPNRSLHYFPLEGLTPPTVSDRTKAYISFYKTESSQITVGDKANRPWEFFEDTEDFNFLYGGVNPEEGKLLIKTIPIALLYSGQIIQLLDIDYFFCFFKDFKKKWAVNFLETEEE